MPRSGLHQVATGCRRSHDAWKQDVEAQPRAQIRQRFRDVVGSVVQDARRQKMQKALDDNVLQNSLEKYRKHDDEIKAMKKLHVSKKVRKFYENQNEILDDWLEVDSVVLSISDDIVASFDPHDTDGDGFPDPVGGLHDTGDTVEPFLPASEREKRLKAKKRASLAININVGANILLLIAKVVACFFSSSLSLIASTADSALDLLCTIIVFSTTWLVERKIRTLSNRFPIGRRRLEPIGILVFSIIMIVSFIEILQESAKKIMPGSPRSTALLPPSAIGAMLGTVILKGIIGLGCMRIKTTQVQALAQDCKTDVIFNTLSLLFPLVGHRFNIWWLDPVGAGLLSIFIIYDWANTCLTNVARLTGVTTNDRILKKLMFLCYRFAPCVDAFKSIKAYHAGDGVWCEVDLLLPQTTPLEHSHDVAETLQYCLEGLQEVDRAFVTVDYATKGPSGHVAQN
ncbi:hypothetical protein FH972_022981 [Carpinus fangiana]|uniref:Cation efflux protein transmembrane domain-containing protein n=1 Tax=Carpinus fangiana TaxID=176857 RepID=A0A5N6KUG6_9ROSI|nr:hypothetical protein FH972_022981 [Carpinus fangiana]